MLYNYGFSSSININLFFEFDIQDHVKAAIYSFNAVMLLGAVFVWLMLASHFIHPVIANSIKLRLITFFSGLFLMIFLLLYRVYSDNTFLYPVFEMLGLALTMVGMLNNHIFSVTKQSKIFIFGAVFFVVPLIIYYEGHNNVSDVKLMSFIKEKFLIADNRIKPYEMFLKEKPNYQVIRVLSNGILIKISDEKFEYISDNGKKVIQYIQNHKVTETIK